MMLDISALNQLSQHLCEAVNDQLRREAEETLTKIIESDDCLRHCILLLEQGEQPYGLVVAGSALKRLLSRKIGITVSDRLELSRYLLKYLVERVTTLKIHYKFALNSLCKIFALLTKVGWLERDQQTDGLPFQEPIRQLMALGKNTTSEGYLALKLLTALVEEINSDEGLDTISKQRKIASDLRDTFLLDIFILSIDILKSSLTAQQNETAMFCTSQALDLALACVNFDFIGSMNDETLDENVNIQVPTKWRPVLVDREVPKMFYDLYATLPAEIVSKVFQILVQLASVRRMLFDTADRQKYLDQMINGMKLVLENSEKLQEPENFHQFCRMVSRVKANYQVAELLKCPNFLSLLSLLAQFTIESFRMSEMLTPNSIYYLLSFWSRMAGSLSYARVDVDAIAVYIPQICAAFIQSRNTLSEAVVRDNREDPLDDLGSLKQTMELFTGISRRNYKETVQKLITLFDENMNILIHSNIAQPMLQVVTRKRLIWIITMMAAGVNGKAASNNCDLDDDVYDGEVVSRVWKLMRETDAMLVQQTSLNDADLQLEFAYLYLMDEFRKAYISDQIQRESHVYDKLAQELGISDDAAALKLFAQKIITNLKFWGKNEKLLSVTLSLLNDLTVGFANVRRLLKTEEIQLLLRNHSVFEFISASTDVSIMRTRTNFYAALVRLLSIELEDDSSVFEPFMQPLMEKFKELYTVFQSGNISGINQEPIRLAVIGLCRDLRGIVTSCSKKSSFTLFLNWSLPETFAVMRGAIQLWSDDADVTTPILKLLAEMTLNRQSRLNYDMHSCSSVVLFREVSKILCDYGNRLLALPEVPKEKFYKQRVKNIGVICFIIRHVLSGNYLPFGVFWIYGDRCLTDALDIAFKLFIRVQEDNLLTYMKLAQCIYYWLDIVTRDNMSYISKLDEGIFIAILKAIHRGILAVDTTIISSSCTVLDQILDYLFERLSRPATKRSPLTKEPEGDNCIHAIEKNSNLLAELMTSILNQLVFEEVKCQWSMSRPLLGLIIANNAAYAQWKNDFMLRQPANVRPVLEQAFVKLMDGIKDNISLKNKDNFTQNLCTFRKEVELAIKGTSALQNSTDGDFADNQFMSD